MFCLPVKEVSQINRLFRQEFSPTPPEFFRETNKVLSLLCKLKKKPLLDKEMY